MSTPNPENNKVIATYDGIEEEDNQLPNWWLFTLFGAIVFTFGYWVVYHTSKSLPDIRATYNADVDALKKSRMAANPMSDESILALSKDPAMVEEGKGVFASTCASCHAQQAQGLVGPNLTDKYWIHGSKPTDIANAVTNGFPDKGMPPWGTVLGPEKVRKVAAFVMSIRDTNVAGKAPQGKDADGNPAPGEAAPAPAPTPAPAAADDAGTAAPDAPAAPSGTP